MTNLMDRKDLVPVFLQEVCLHYIDMIDYVSNGSSQFGTERLGPRTIVGLPC